MGALLIFDLDGTLVDSRGLIETSMKEACLLTGWPQPEPRTVWRVVGLPLVEACRRMGPADASLEDVSRCSEHFQRIHEDLLASPNFVLPIFRGVDTLLDDLTDAGCTLAIATGKPRAVTNDILRRTQLARFFKVVVTADDGPGKPNPFMVNAAKNAATVGARSTIVIGDSVHDVQMAANAGVPVIGVSWGFEAAEPLRAHGAQRVVHTMDQLRVAIRHELGHA